MLQCPRPVLYIGGDVYVLLSYNHLPIVSIEFTKSLYLKYTTQMGLRLTCASLR